MAPENTVRIHVLMGKGLRKKTKQKTREYKKVGEIKIIAYLKWPSHNINGHDYERVCVHPT